MAESPIKNPELTLAMKMLKAEDTPDARKEFSRALGGARLLAPVKLEKELSEHDRQPDGSVALEPKTKVQYILFNRSDGKKVFPAFTDWEQLHKWNTEPCQTLILTIQDYARLVNQPNNEAAGIALNPMSHNLFVPCEGLRPVKTMAKPLFDKARPVSIGTPKELPQPLVDGLQKIMVAQPAIAQGWLKIMSQDETHSWLLVVDIAPDADVKALCTALAKSAAPLTGKVPMTVTPHASDLGRKAATNTLPFYIKA